MDTSNESGSIPEARPNSNNPSERDDLPVQQAVVYEHRSLPAEPPQPEPEPNEQAEGFIRVEDPKKLARGEKLYTKDGKFLGTFNGLYKGVLPIWKAPNGLVKAPIGKDARDVYIQE